MEERKFNYVYITTNLKTKKQYVGSHSTNNLNDNYLGSGNYFKNTLKKYGKENFKKQILKKCKTIKEAKLLEELNIKKYNTLFPNGYNISPTGGMKGTGGRHSKETIEKIRKKLKGKKCSKEHCKNISKGLKGKYLGNKNGMYGKHHTKEAKIKIYNANIGKKYSKEVNKSKGRKGKDNKLFGIKRSEEFCKKIRDNRPNFNGEKNPMYGKIHSKESIYLMKLKKLKYHNIDINKEKLLEIKFLYKKISNVKIAEKYNISYSTVRNIFRGNYDWLSYGI